MIWSLSSWRAREGLRRVVVEIGLDSETEMKVKEGSQNAVVPAVHAPSSPNPTGSVLVPYSSAAGQVGSTVQLPHNPDEPTSSHPP